MKFRALFGITTKKNGQVLNTLSKRALPRWLIGRYLASPALQNFDGVRARGALTLISDDLMKDR